MNYYMTIQPQGDPNSTGNDPKPTNNQQVVPVSQEVFNDQAEAQTRNIHAMARINEGIILLNGMAEIRMALNIPSVAEDDAGTGERPALKPMFEPEQIRILQQSYLSISERYHRFVHHMMKHELGIGKIEDETKPEK